MEVPSAQRDAEKSPPRSARKTAPSGCPSSSSAFMDSPSKNTRSQVKQGKWLKGAHRAAGDCNQPDGLDSGSYEHDDVGNG